MEFNQKLYELRKQKGITQEELSECIFVSRAAISKWESGRGYPSIDSLKALATFFGITVDELLSGDEILMIAKNENKNTKIQLHNILFGVLDCSAAMLFLLPFCRQQIDQTIQNVSLLSITELSPWLKITYLVITFSIVLLGIITLAMQGANYWRTVLTKISLVLNIAIILLFIMGLQPYAASFLFVFLIIKLFTLIKT